MADAWQSAWVEVVPDFRNFGRTANSEMTGILGNAGDSAGNRAGEGIKGGILGTIGKLAAPIAIAFAGLQVGKLLSDSINIASDLNEAGTAINAVFGDAAADIQAFAAKGAKAFGETNLATLQAAQTFGIYGKAAGLAGADLTGFTTDLVGLGTDLASFFNTDTQTAIDAIGAGLRGESEPLRQFGVLLDDATLKSRAMALGISDGTGSLTQQQRVLAAQAEILAQTTTAQGDFERTSGGLANQQKILAASFEDAKGKLGTALLPAMTQLATLANDTLVPILDDLITKVGPVLGDALVELAPSFTELILAVAPLIPDLVMLAVSVIPLIVDALNLLMPVIQFVVQGATGFYDTISLLIGFINGEFTLTQMVSQLQSVTGPFGVVMKAAVDLGLGIGQFVAFAVANLQSFAATAGTKIGEVIGFFTGIKDTVVGALSGAGEWLVDSGKAIIQGFIDGISGMVDAVKNTVGNIMDTVASFFPHSPAEQGPFSGSGWRAVEGAGVAIGEQFASGLTSARGAVAFATNGMVSGVSLPSAKTSDYAYVSPSGVGSSGGTFAGNLYLSSGEFLGAVRGEINNADDGNRVSFENGLAR